MPAAIINQIYSRYNKIITLISGEKENLSLEKRIYNIAAFLLVLIGILSTAGNIFLKLHFIYVLVFSTLMYSYLKKSFDQERDKTVNQRKEIENKHKEIKSSIRYASKIQTALLPSYNLLKEYFNDSFVFWVPKHIVTGDFYWVKEIEGKTVVATVDCTGHGVPDAFMSILGISLLNEIILHNKVTQPNLILNQLRTEVKKSLQQIKERGSAKDGMDMAICTIDKKEYKM